MKSIFVFLDIGFTMIGGPEIGPSAWLIRALGLPPNAKETLKSWLFTTPLSSAEELTQRLLQTHDLNPDQTRQVVQGFWQQQIETCFPLPGARDLLVQLEAEGIRYGFITNIWTPFLLGFARLFPGPYAQAPVVASCQTGLSKPDAGIYRQALTLSGLAPEQTVMIGDTYAMDMLPAINLGMKSVWLLHRPEKERDDLVALLNRQQPTPDLTLASMEALRVERLLALWSTK
ncbi:MAG: HAD family hydrolase [Magnetococcales bacterium]|nr:HAD family hydrolase [Magnetococcales bacterium]NGZ06737.1 HAD family hydrolase [Magnetococcales bacterium]